MKEYISSQARRILCEILSKWSTLRKINNYFTDANIQLADDFEELPPLASGQRMHLIEGFYRSLNFSKWNDSKKILKVYEYVLFDLQSEINQSDEKDFNRILSLLKRDGILYNGGILHHETSHMELNDLKEMVEVLDVDHLAEQIARIEKSVEDDPCLAIGTAKELVETCCKTILNDRNILYTKNADIPDLLKMTFASLKILPEEIPDSSKGVDSIRRILRSLTTIANGLAELRGLYGTGHGKEGNWKGAKGIKSRHAKLAVGAATTLVVFLLETHKQQ